MKNIISNLFLCMLDLNNGIDTIGDWFMFRIINMHKIIADPGLKLMGGNPQTAWVLAHNIHWTRSKREQTIHTVLTVWSVFLTVFFSFFFSFSLQALREENVV